MLELDGLRRRFGEVVALVGLSFDVARGQLCGFVGPNGAGKTTAMRCVVGVTRPDAGEVRWDGAPLDAGVRRRIGYLPEERGLYPKMRVTEHLVYLARLRGLDPRTARRRSDELLAGLELTGRAHDPIETLSLGNQQRVQFAAAIVHDPDLLVLDEPFSGLDPIAVDVMIAVLRERAAAGVAVVFSSHQLDLVEGLCETVAVVVDGRTVLHGPVASLRARGRARLRVGVEASVQWTAGLPTDVEVIDRRGGVITVALGAGEDPGPVLDVARRAGRLTHVGLDQPRLAELFRNAMPARERSDAVAGRTHGGTSS